MLVRLSHPDKPFLCEKINELQTALFFSETSALLRIATTVIHVLKTDDTGYVWFFVPRPRQVLREFEKEFPVRLEFFRKGKPFFLQCTGKAFLISDHREAKALMEEGVIERVTDRKVLIRMSIVRADYYERIAASPSSWWQDLLQQCSNWMYRALGGAIGQ